jgi:hypothetical protein
LLLFSAEDSLPKSSISFDLGVSVMAHCDGDLLSRRLHQETVEDLLDLDDDKFRAMCSAFGYLQEWPDLSAMCGTNNLGVPGMAAPDAGNDDSSCSGDGFRKRKTDSCLDAKVRDLSLFYEMCTALCNFRCVFG